MKHFRGEKRFYYGMTVLVLVFIIAGLTSNLEGGVCGNRQEKEAFDQKQEEVQTEQKNQGEETQVVSNPNIRVLLMTNGYKNTIHPSVTVSSTTGLSITYGEKVEECEAGTEVTFMPDDSRFQSGNIRIQAKEGEITVNSLKRGYGIPSYQGILELRTTAEGIAIINELPVENYLCRVVPSEMPSGYEIEALKAQAVCARSYAYRQMAEYGYPEYEAHVDDSTSYQVYHKIDSQTSTDQAVEETAESFRDLAQSKGHELSLSIAPGLIYTGDEYALRQLVSILLDNAIKYAAPGTEVRLDAVRQGKNACLWVENEGEPIPADKLSHIFDRFYRADESRTDGGSFGLGLSIAKAIVEAHRGAIRCDSGGSTTRFTITLPCRQGK